MLGKTPLVSMSDKRLGGMENSSLRYFSAMRALDVSISRMVNPSFSRRVRRLLPAGSMTALHRLFDIIAGCGPFCVVSSTNFLGRTAFVTISEQDEPLAQPGK